MAVGGFRLRPVSAGAAAALAAALALASPAGAAERVALLVGIGDYGPDALDLRNPTNDVAALAPVLEGLGFDVTVVENPGVIDFAEALAAFAEKARKSEIGALFFAGHGIQIAGENYFIASDIPAATLDGVRDHAITLTQIRDVFAAADPETSLIILDACRNTPDVDLAAVAAEGLAPVPRGFPGYLIAYATDPGNVAEDGTGANSTFTTALLDHLATPDLDIRLVFGRVRQEVVLETGGAQVPWVEESLIDEVVLRDTGAPVTTAEIRDEIAFWRTHGAVEDPEGLRRYLDRYPDGMFAAIARDRIDALSRIAASDAAPQAVADIAEAAEPDRLASALVALGYLPESAADAPDRPTLVRAVEFYARAAGGPVQVGQIYTEAARATALTAASLAQRIRVDIAALASVDKLRQVAGDAAREIAEIAARDVSARPALQEARARLAEIDAARDRILARLDQSREYYGRQVRRAADYFEPYMTPALIGGARGIGDGAPDAAARLRQDAQAFLKHVERAADPRTRGSVAWLADFLPG